MCSSDLITLFGESVGRLSFYGQGAGKYPTGNSLAQDVIDILNGNTALDYPKNTAVVDNVQTKRKYYIRTVADVSLDFVNSKECIDGVNYILTNKVGVKNMHEAAKMIFVADKDAFFAGIEE